MAEPWERQEGETSKAFGAFIVYRNLAVQKRSVFASVRELYGEESAGKVRLFQRWSAKYNWVSRARAWDDEVDRKARADLIDEIEKARRRHVKEAQMLQQKAIERLSKMDPDELGTNDVLRYFIEAAKLERTALGEPESIVEIDWRAKAKNAGINPDTLVQEIARAVLRDGDQPDSA